VSLTSPKINQNVLAAGGVREVVQTATTSGAIPSRGVHVVGAGVHDLADPTVAGARVTVVFNSSDAVVQTASSSVTFGGTGTNTLTATTTLDTTAAVDLVSTSTTRWAIGALPTGITLSATTR